MSLNIFSRALPTIFASSLVLALGGCATKDERAAQRKWETQDERASREVFRSDWLIPSVSNEDKDFFYRSWLRNGD
jgi:hypothetical protein